MFVCLGFLFSRILQSLLFPWHIGIFRIELGNLAIFALIFMLGFVYVGKINQVIMSIINFFFGIVLDQSIFLVAKSPLTLLASAKKVSISFCSSTPPVF